MPATVLRQPARPSRLGSRRHLLPVLVFVVALVVRGLHWWGQMRHNPFFYAPIMDERMHHEWAQLIAAGQGLGNKPFFRAPLYYYLVAAIYALVGPQIAIARLAGCVLGAASCSLLACIGVRLGGLAVGLMAGLLAAFYWPLIHFDEQLLTVGLEIFLNLLTLELLLRATGVDTPDAPVEAAGSSRLWYLAAGVTMGLSALARPNVLVLAPAIAVWLWLVLGGAPHAAGTGARLGRVGLLMAGLLTAILPVTIRNRLVGGEWVLIATNGGVNFYIGNNPQADGIAAVVPGTRADWEGGYEDTHRIPEQELGRRLTEGQVSDYWFRKGLAWIRTDPTGWLRLTLRKLRLFWMPHEIPNNQPIRFFASLADISPLYFLGFPPIAALGLAGLTVLGGRWRWWSLVVLFGVIYMGTVVLFFCPARYRLPVVPLLILLTAGGLAGLREAWRGRRVRRIGLYFSVAGGVTLFMLLNRPGADWKRQEEGRAYHNLGSHYARLAQADPSQRQRALSYLFKAVRLRPADPYLHIAIGTWLTLFDRADEAGEYFAKGVQLLPTYAEGRQAYGDWLFERQRFAEAAEEYRAALERRPDLLEARYRLGRCQARLGSLSEAVTTFEQVLRQQPDLVPALFDLATGLSRLGRPAEALRFYRAVLQLEPDNLPAAQRLARHLFQLGESAEALEVLEHALRHHADEPTLLVDLAGLLVSTPDAALRDGRRAIELVQRALEHGAERSVELLDTLAAAHAELGQFRRAVEVLREALTRAANAGDQELVGKLAARLRQYEAALEHDAGR